MSQVHRFACFLFISMTSCSGPGSELDSSDNILEQNDTRISYDTIWYIDSSEYEVGILIGGKKLGLWCNYYVRDTSHWEERYYDGNEYLIRSRSFDHGRQYLEQNYLSNGIYSISYYENGCVNSMGWTRTVEGHEGEGDGLWVEYDSLGNLYSETFYDYKNDKIVYKEYEPTQHFLVKECEYYQETGEASLFKNGTWKYYKHGQLDHIEEHNMEPTLEDFGQ